MVGETGIWSAELAEETHVWSPKLAAAMSTLLIKQYGDTVVDLGCGVGYYVKYLQNNGHFARGFEGTSDIEFITDGIWSTDLTAPRVSCPMLKYIDAICLEVGEHIPQEYEQQFIDNIVKFATRRLIISWAIPNQLGIGHVNCREQSYIIDEIQRRGFKLQEQLSEYLRQNVDDHTPWFRDTILVFDKL